MATNQIIVTGGLGYIGSHTTVELIKSGYQPVIIDNLNNSSITVLDQLKKITGQEIPFHQIDCNDKDAMKIVFEQYKQIAGVIHFAAYKAVGESVAHPLKYYYNNVNSLVVLLEVMKEHKISNLVFSSSCTVYGEPESLPVFEHTPRQVANSPYGNTKQICEDIINDFVSSEPSFKSIILRYFNPIGAHPSGLIGELPIGVPGNLVPFVTQTAAGIREQLTVFGDDYNTPDGTCIRDYIHVVDLADAHVKALDYSNKSTEQKLNEVFNIGTGNGNSVLEIVNVFETVSQQKLNYKIGARRSGDIEKIYADVQKSKDKLGWQCEFSLKDALTDAWRWQMNLKKN